MVRCLLGVDDTDSAKGLCTTFLGYSLARKLEQERYEFTGYPRLVRLNPNVPFKTRGNAAVCLSVEAERPEDLLETCLPTVKELSDVAHGANTGLVLLWNLELLPQLRALYRRALAGIVNKHAVGKLLGTSGLSTFTLGNGMGIVGAASSLGFDDSQDHTYELIAYRRASNWGKPRMVSKDSVKNMEANTFPDTFNSFDPAKDRILVTPHGPDPVFLGVRGNTPNLVQKGFRMLEYEEELEGWMIYVSNQGTDAHLRERLSLPFKAYSSGQVGGRVSSVVVGSGGHVYLKLASQGQELSLAIYEPTGDLGKVARRLAAGDVVSVWGGVRRRTGNHPELLNVEKLQVHSIIRTERDLNPKCFDCGSRMKSEGLRKGFQCPRCGKKLLNPVIRHRSSRRDIRTGIYLPSPRAHRHLTKPLVRYRRELSVRRYPLIPEWFSNGASGA
jgi:tRNA(Ile2)-agmatinylcytidine synthase